jgi:hypothetical protein
LASWSGFGLRTAVDPEEGAEKDASICNILFGVAEEFGGEQTATDSLSALGPRVSITEKLIAESAKLLLRERERYKFALFSN